MTAPAGPSESFPSRAARSVLDRLQRRFGARAVRRLELLAHVSPGSLLWHYGNVYSQRGQDGILREIFARLAGRIGSRFVEFGAWDGVYLSNCRWLAEQGWDGTFIEADPVKFRTLQENYRGSRQRVIQESVGAPAYGVRGRRLAEILAGADTRPDDVAFVSVDVDGPDLEVFLDAGFKPPVALIEGGLNFHPAIAQAADVEAGTPLQHPLGYIVRRLAGHGYTPVCFHQDTYAVRNDLAAPFAGVPASAVDLYRDAFCFMDDVHRSDLLALRKRDGRIRAFEVRELGAFAVDPVTPGS
jgi:hypothetical protein